MPALGCQLSLWSKSEKIIAWPIVVKIGGTNGSCVSEFRHSSNLVFLAFENIFCWDLDIFGFGVTEFEK